MGNAARARLNVQGTRIAAGPLPLCFGRPQCQTCGRYATQGLLSDADAKREMQLQFWRWQARRIVDIIRTEQARK